MDLLFKPSELSVISNKICRKERVSYTTEEVNDVFVRAFHDGVRYSKENRISDDELVGAVLWTAENYSDENMKNLMRLWYERHSFGALRLLYSEWQEVYDSEYINDICSRITETENIDSKWIVFWKRLIRCGKPECVAAGFAGAYCHEKNIDFNTWKNIFRLNNSRFERRVSDLFFCFCYSSNFTCSDNELLLCIEKMSDMHCELLLRNILTCFQNEDTKDVLNVKYAQSYQKIIERIPHNWCVKKSLEKQ